MRIAVIGSGAMGSLFGGYLSRTNEVFLIDVSQKIADAINDKGLIVEEKDGSNSVFPVKCYTDSSSLPPVDLMILFVKSMYSKSALEANRALLGKDTYVLSLQNGAGHEELLSQYADPHHVLFGTTQHNCAVIEPGRVRHGGSGLCHVGRLDGTVDGLEEVIEAFRASGFDCEVSTSVNHMVWAKLFTNVAASALTGVLMCPLGYISRNENARKISRQLVHEAVAVAAADGEPFDEEEEFSKVMAVCDNSPEGITSIYADLANGRKTEVDTISGAVVRKAKKYGVGAPYHELIVDLIHAFENKEKNK